MKTITNLRELDELVAQQLGYVKYTWEKECSKFTPGASWVNGSEYYAVTCSTYIPKELYDKTDEEWEADYENNLVNKPYSGYYSPTGYYSSLNNFITSTDYEIPYFSSDYSAMEEVLNYFSIDKIRVNISKDQQLTKVELAFINSLGYYPNNTSDYTIRCGNVGNRSSCQADCTINSLPLAISLLLLKYKNINVKVKIK